MEAMHRSGSSHGVGRAARKVVVLGLLAVICTTAGASATDFVQDKFGRRWQQVGAATGFSWNEIAAVCPTDGVSPCFGALEEVDLAGWTWATSEQVVELMSSWAPPLARAEPPVVSGDQYFFRAVGFTTEMLRTGWVGGTYFYSEWNTGWTASIGDTGLPIIGSASWGWWPISGYFSVYQGVDPDDAASDRGIWLFQKRPGAERN